MANGERDEPRYLLEVADDVGLTVSVIGTPGEELIGLKEPPAGYLTEGKIALLEAGAFDGLHAVLMVHPGATPYSEFIPSLAGQRFRARFERARAGAVGIGSDEAEALSEALMEALRPLGRSPYFCRVQPETDDSGARADLLAAAASLAQLGKVRDGVRGCFRAAASEAGVTVAITEYVPVAELCNDPRLAAAFRGNAQALGRVRERDPDIKAELRDLSRAFMKRLYREPRLLGKLLHIARHPAVGLFLDQAPVDVLYGTDLGNVSQIVPSIHPLIGIGGTASNNTAEFTPLADTNEAYRAMLDAATALAWTAIDAATDIALRSYLLARRPTAIGVAA